MLEKGRKAPDKVFVQDHANKDVSLADLLGKWVVLYFYPKDDTPGCTKEAIGFRDFANKLKRSGAVVVGVSKDKPKSHQKFIDKYSLNFTLWSDPEHLLMEAFGTWQEKRFMGRTYMGTTRSTFLIDPQGKIMHVWEEVKPEGHAEEVLEVLKKNI